MILHKSTLIFLIFAFATVKVLAQANPYISVLPSNSGVVAVGANNDLLIVVGNTGTASIAVSKLRPVVTIPASVNFLADALQTGLPAGWTILSNTGSQLRFCNSGFVVPGQSQTEIILKVQGVSIAGPTTFSGQINFGNGTTCAAGPSVTGNNTADDFATSTIEVTSGPVPLTLVNFNATLLNCQPYLNWVTESELNTAYFEIERNDLSNTSAGWKTIGKVTANGTLQKSTYKFFDATLNATSVNVFYRLKMIDKDGLYKYSEALRVNVNCKTIQMDVYPNPVQNGKLYVSLTGAGENIQASLLSVSGQVVSKTKMNNGTNYVSTTNIADGVYILNITDANGLNKKVKVLIQH